jgi:hypothetical protein
VKKSSLDPYLEVWLVDFEFQASLGERQKPICMVALELKSGRLLRIWEDELLQMTEPPFPSRPDMLFVAYYASAELGCYLALDWPMPAKILDLYLEFRDKRNGLGSPAGFGLLGAATSHGLSCLDAAEKEEMRSLALRGGPWCGEERKALLDYCESDVRQLEQLLPAMIGEIDLPRALLRGRYMAAVAHMEFTGVPIDMAALDGLKANWDGIQLQLIRDIDQAYEVFEERSFRASKFAEYLARNGIPWPRLVSGMLDLSDDAFRQMARAYPAVSPLRELRYSLSQMRLAELAVGTDGRNRTLLSPFKARTGRNQPSNSKFIFGPSTWLRGLIKPEPGYGLAYVDWSQQEFGIAAALSADEKMLDAYRSGDPYMSFAIQAGAAPKDATKKTHGETRDQFKACVLAVQYGMGAKSLAVRIGGSEARANELLALHKRVYERYWAWSDGVLDHAMLMGRLWTVFGWNLRPSTDPKTGAPPNPRSIRNFPMQANGAEMLRLGCCLLTEAGVRVCAPVHDALLIEARLEDLDDQVALTQKLMRQASGIILSGFELESDAKLVRHPDRYMDVRGEEMWAKVWKLIGEAA